MPKKHTFEYVKNKIKSMGGILISKSYLNNTQKLKIICDKKHKIQMCFAEIQDGSWCKKCSDIAKSKRYALPYNFVKQEIEKHGGTLISKEYINDSTSLEIMCAEKHNFKTTYDTIRSGSWCAVCANINRSKKLSYTYDFVKNTIEQKGGILRSKEYSGCKKKISILCGVGHIFDMTFDSIMTGYWCRKCASIKNGKKIAHTYEFIKDIVEKHGGILITKEYTNARTTLKIICDKGHAFETNYARIGINGSWCSYCPASKAQTKLKIILDELLKTEILQNYKKFDWLKNTKTGLKLEIDLWVPELKLAIEYDGEQHFTPVCFGGITKKEASKNLEQTKYLDHIKNNLIKNNSSDIKYFVRFNYKEDITEEYIREKLKKYRIMY